MVEFKHILMNDIAYFEENQPQLRKYMAGRTQVYRYNNRLNYVTPEADLDKARFVLENAALIFQPEDYNQTALRKQYYNSLRRELDIIILGVIYETLKKEPLKMDALGKVSHEDQFEVLDIGLANNIESVAQLYKLNQSLITYLRENIIITSSELFQKHRQKTQMSEFKEAIKAKISKMIAMIHVKNPTSHERVERVNLDCRRG